MKIRFWIVRNTDVWARSTSQPKLFGQDWNDAAWAVCKSVMFIKGEDADATILGDIFTKDGFDRAADGTKWVPDKKVN